ncbi:hypothetical protein Moror_5382 [Moniliophthora roreri MCA 2997]|uniref:Uncharacterized protein n=1 Tax=Moniliophthora roreri (strain MCA 2997) TaxID=1381753 RepID=V2WP58_MONRO|nr:hypothetical protein Moror_5382 [Moniliophthora roreri MCA 2997]
MLHSISRTASVPKSSLLTLSGRRIGLGVSRRISSTSTRIIPSPSQRWWIPSSNNETRRTFKTSTRRLADPDPVTPAFVFPPDELLKSLELTAKTQLPPIPPGEDKEVFWRAYLLANQIILYLGARPPAEAEAFASVLQAASVAPDSAVARGRSALARVSRMIVASMDYLPNDSKLRTEHADVVEAYERFAFIVESYQHKEQEGDFDLDAWSRFFNGLRTDLIQFAVKIGKVVEKWE